ncbi:protein of unknown function DUF167 [Methanothermus fervidus DSM 2088]|uniref:UPF0235 protein Mfer_0383 n=1 Tax=Methanothermus fervidus (strain ATCC 43054 / DSM 2088 / JCM 10308 / V24 S) TaxID=523846 RepID=E3GY03_METFV|nr:DUF167 domain-containing protein [Methanothermus fervidus]ADP77185.1 protein of unknown function DUF167 [Methanothermus fervidus DSM 2088]
MEAIMKKGSDVLLQIHVIPSSKKFGIEKYDSWRKRLYVTVKSPARKGKANKEIIEEFSKLFNKEVKIVKGIKSRDKTLVVKDVEYKKIMEIIRGKLK